MNNLNYPITKDILHLSRDYRAGEPFEKPGIFNPAIQSENKLHLISNIKLSGKIRLVLSFIYFFSLIFFTLQLLT